MATDLEPIAGNWYRNVDDDLVFEVVTVDEDEALIEIQHEDGDIEQVDLEDWQDWELEVVSEPEDWSPSLDDSEAGQLADEDEDEESRWNRSPGGPGDRSREDDTPGSDEGIT